MSCLFKVTLDGILGLMFLFIHLKTLIFRVLGNSLCTMTLSGFSVIFLEHASPSTLSDFYFGLFFVKSMWTGIGFHLSHKSQGLIGV